MEKRIPVMCPVCGDMRTVSPATFEQRPRFLVYCQPCGRHVSDMHRKTPKHEVEMFGCTLKLSEFGRCDKYWECENYEKCLDVADEMGWMGWSTA